MSLPGYAINQPSFPEMYERWLVGPLFRPWAEITLEELDAARNDRILDIGCGTGIVARVARERLGTSAPIVGVDLSPDMLAVARKVAPDIDWGQGNAVSLPLNEGERFDVVICQQALQFMPDKPEAVAQMRRALDRGGRLAVSTWRSDDESPFFRELRGVAERRLGDIADQRFGLGDAAPIAALLRDAGFHDITSKIVSRIIRLPDGEIFARLNAMALVGMSAAGKGRTEEDKKRAVEMIQQESEPVLRSYSEASAVAFELRTNLVLAKG